MVVSMPDFEQQIEQAEGQLEDAIYDLEMWESFGPTTITNETTGEVTDFRAQMIDRCKQNIALYERIVAALESRAQEG
jgi:hypothetical protein